MILRQYPHTDPVIAASYSSAAAVMPLVRSLIPWASRSATSRRPLPWGSDSASSSTRTSTPIISLPVVSWLRRRVPSTSCTPLPGPDFVSLYSRKC